jgi:threonine dehydrogenase-like Zn-dependent dehydrogenase
VHGLWLEKQELQFREDLPNAATSSGEIVVRTLLAGICNTDLELTRGYYPFTGVPGHEFVGLLEDGRRVVGEINVACGTCATCRREDRTHCEKRSVLGIARRNGAFAEFLTLPAGNLHIVPDEVTNEEAVFVEPLAAALEIQEQVRITPQHRVLVVGDGKLGQLVAQTLALTGCDLAVIGRHPEKLALLETRGIATATSDLIAPRSFDVAVECTGNPSGFDVARQALRPRGTLVMKSTYAGNLTVNASSLVVDEITLIGSRCGPFAKALDLLRDRRVDVRPLIDSTYPLADGVRAFQRAEQPGTLKVIIRVDDVGI